MFCTNCGTQLPDGSRFCSQCGAPQTAAAPAQGAYQQPVYQQPAAPTQQPVYQQPAAPVYQQPVYPQGNYAQQAAATGALLMEAGKVTRYNGGKAIGVVTGTGDLYVYDDRIEFYKKTGDQRGYMLGPVVGAVLSINGAKKNPVDIYEFRDVANVRTGKYAGMMGTVVLELKNGKAVSFVPASGKSRKIAEQICELIAPYI